MVADFSRTRRERSSAQPLAALLPAGCGVPLVGRLFRRQAKKRSPEILRRAFLLFFDRGGLPAEFHIPAGICPVDHGRERQLAFHVSAEPQVQL